MSNKNDIKSHHVPQTYLSGFSCANFPLYPGDEKQIYTYLKVRKEGYLSKIGNTAAEARLYQTNGGMSVSAIESLFGEFENGLSEIIEGLRTGTYNSSTKLRLRHFISNQLTRTTFIIEQTKKLYENITEHSALLDQKIKEYPFDKYRMDYLDLIFSSFLNVLERSSNEAPPYKVWINRTEMPFITSDNPVIIMDNEESPYQLSRIGFSLFLPLSSNVLLQISSHDNLPSVHMCSYKKIKNDFQFSIADDPAFVRGINSMIFKFAYKQVFSPSEQTIKTLYKEKHLSPILDLNTLQDTKDVICEQIIRDYDNFFLHKDDVFYQQWRRLPKYVLNMPVTFVKIKP